MLQTMLQQTLHDEFTRFLGAAPFERTEARAGLRNGSRPRTLVTRVGKLALPVPRDCQGSPTLTQLAITQSYAPGLFDFLGASPPEGVGGGDAAGGGVRSLSSSRSR